MRNHQTAPPLRNTSGGVLPTLSVELKPLRDLKPDPGNARLHSEKQVGQLVKSITAFGFCVPVLVDRGGHVIAGHGRLLAAKQLGWSGVPTITLDHLSPDQVRALRIADNRLTDCSSWDERLLGEQLRLLSSADLDFDLEAIGFDMAEIDLAIQNLGTIDDEPEGDPSPTNEAAVTQVGDLWCLGLHRLLCGSALDATAYDVLLRGERAAMVFTDPPYNVPIAGHVSGNGAVVHREFAMASGEMTQPEFGQFLSLALSNMKRVCVDGALLFVFMDWRGLATLSAAGDAQALELKNICVWNKGTGGMGSLYRSQHELVMVYKSGKERHTNNVQLGRYGRNRTNVWDYSGINSFARKTDEGNLLASHPTVKPVALIADAILDASERGEVVLDPFFGSGSTLIAAEKTGRVAFGIELDPTYVDVAVRRWQRLTGQPARHGVTRQTFDEIAHDRAGQLPRADEHTDSLAEGEGS